MGSWMTAMDSSLAIASCRPSACLPRNAAVSTVSLDSGTGLHLSLSAAMIRCPNGVANSLDSSAASAGVQLFIVLASYDRIHVAVEVWCMFPCRVRRREHRHAAFSPKQIRKLFLNRSVQFQFNDATSLCQRHLGFDTHVFELFNHGGAPNRSPTCRHTTRSFQVCQCHICPDLFHLLFV